MAGGAIGVLIKSLLLVLEKSHNLVFYWDKATKQTRLHANKRSYEKKEDEKEGWSGGDENERQIARR